MAHLDQTGPEKKGKLTGRGLGKCTKVPLEVAFETLGKGMGLRRKSGGGRGQGKCLKSAIK